jgi:hypothetical protein
MKNFRIQIYAYGYRADFVITAKDDPKNIEDAIVDKLGQNDIVWDSIGEMSDPNIKRITYEEVVNDPQSHPRPLQEKKVVGA